MPDLSPAEQVVMGDQHICVLDTSGQVWCRGYSLATFGLCHELVHVDLAAE